MTLGIGLTFGPPALIAWGVVLLLAGALPDWGSR